MVSLLLRQKIILWGFLACLIAFSLCLGQLQNSQAQVLLEAADGVYLQTANKTYYFFDEASFPLWSPDGNWIALQSPQQFSLLDELSRINYQLNLPSYEQFTYRPIWSEDSHSIVLVNESTTESQYGLLLYNRNTQILMQYPLHNEEVVLLYWENPNTIRFVTLGNGIINLWELSLADDTPQRLQTWNFELYMHRDAILNPDKQSFILPAITASIQNFELYQFNFSGSIENLSNRPSHNDTNPIWSPTGAELAYRALSGGNQFIILRPQDSREEKVIARFDGVFIRDMQWIDTHRISLISAYSGQSRLCTLDVLTEEVICSEPTISFANLSWRPH